LHSVLEPCRAVGFAEADRTRVDADESFRYGARIDATPWDGTDIHHVGSKGIIEPATPKGSRSRIRLFNRWAIDRLRICRRHISDAAPRRGGGPRASRPEVILVQQPPDTTRGLRSTDTR